MFLANIGDIVSGTVLTPDSALGYLECRLQALGFAGQVWEIVDEAGQTEVGAAEGHVTQQLAGFLRDSHTPMVCPRETAALNNYHSAVQWHQKLAGKNSTQDCSDLDR